MPRNSTPVGKASRTKGLTGELEVRRIYEAAGLTVRGLEGSGDHVVLGGRVQLHSESKRQERWKVPEWIRQAEAECGGLVPVVACRRNRGRWWAVLPLDDLVRLLPKGERDE